MGSAWSGSGVENRGPMVGLAEFWAAEYLDWYVTHGGSKVKLVTAKEARTVADFLSKVGDLATSAGYAAYMVDACAINKLKLAGIYQAVLAGVDLKALVSSYCSQIIKRMGYDPEEVDPDLSFADWVSQARGRDRSWVCREIREHLEFDLFRNPAVNRTFAVAVMQLSADQLGASNLPDDFERAHMRDALFAWIRAETVNLRDLKRYHVYTRIDRYNARVMLRSLVQLVRMSGKLGLVLILGGLETLLARHETGRPLYTRAARDEFYESVRQFMDEVEIFGHTMIVLGFTHQLVDDVSSGLRSYEALWLRIQNEIEEKCPNLFRDFIDLDTLSEVESCGVKGIAAVPLSGAEMNAEARAGTSGKNQAVLKKRPDEANRDFGAAAVVETLRSGVTSPSLARLFCYGREALLERVQKELLDVRDDAKPRGFVIKGEYGEGKTHFLNAIADKALRENFAVSFVVLSKETPFSRLDKVYPKLVANTYLPGQSEPGIAALFRDLRPDSSITQDILDFAEKELHPKLYHVLYDYLFTGETYTQYLLEGDLSGSLLPAPFLRSIHRSTAGQSAKFSRFSSKTDVLDYLRLLSMVIKKRGYSGWVLLFDEFELVGTLGVIARGEAYRNMTPFLGLGSPLFESTISFFSVASRYWPDILLRERKPDTAEIPKKLEVRGREAEVRQVERVLKFLLQENIPLEMLTETEVHKMLSSLRESHSRAYSWEATLDIPSSLEATKHVRLRTRIRYALECLDLTYLYREMPAVLTGELQEASLTGEEEDPDKAIL